MIRIGADIGGTFTDLVLASDDGSLFRIGKVLTTPDAPERAVLTAVAEVTEAAGVRPRDVAVLVHGTTLFTNALIERKGARTALITTKGFRDAIEIAREHRYDMYDLRLERPEPLAPRPLRFEVDERVLADGSVRRALDPAEVRALCSRLGDAKVEAVAVSLIHAYRNPVHERIILAVLAEELPHVTVSISSALVPEIREYERTSTVLCNVYVRPIARRYLQGLSNQLTDDLGFAGRLFVMQSNGGVADVAAAQDAPVRLVESGPAGGALAAAHYGRMLGVSDLLSFDMGGTTAKACYIIGGEPTIAPDFEVDRRYLFKKGSGLPVKVPVVEMIEVGTGGGSIASVDAMRRLTVGPRSAGAQPGPACYGLGGEEPTVTDADLLLGYLDPDFFLGGRMLLDAAKAGAAVTSRIADRLGLDLTAAAAGIHQLANETMASAARVHAVERGKDVARFPIFAFGGAGPVHAFGVARILGSPSVIYPRAAGVMSAIGFLTAPLARDLVRSHVTPLQTTDWAAIGALIDEMEEEGRKALTGSVSPAELTFRRLADMRYRKQGFEVRVPLPDGRLDESRFEEIGSRFEAVYRELYGHVLPNGVVEVVSWRVIAEGPRPSLTLPEADREARGSALKGRRQVYVPDVQGFVDVPVYDRYRLAVGTRIKGPVVVEEEESTVVVNGRATITIDDWGNLIAEPVRP